jgi:hypothetical protein
MRALLAVAISVVVAAPAGAQSAPDPHQLLKEDDRLAWLWAWPQAESQFAEPQKLFAVAGDERNASLHSTPPVAAGQPAAKHGWGNG